MELSINNLSQTLRTGGPSGDRDDACDLIFQVDGKDYIIRNAKIYLPEGTPPGSQEYEDYWDDAANVQRAIDEADEIEGDNETKQISVNNGRSFIDPAEALERVNLETMANYMDDQAREQVHAELAPCDDIEFLIRYLEIAPCDLIIG